MNTFRQIVLSYRRRAGALQEPPVRPLLFQSLLYCPICSLTVVPRYLRFVDNNMYDEEENEEYQSALERSKSGRKQTNNLITSTSNKSNNSTESKKNNLNDINNNNVQDEKKVVEDENNDDNDNNNKDDDTKESDYADLIKAVLNSQNESNEDDKDQDESFDNRATTFNKEETKDLESSIKDKDPGDEGSSVSLIDEKYLSTSERKSRWGDKSSLKGVSINQSDNPTSSGSDNSINSKLDLNVSSGEEAYRRRQHGYNTTRTEPNNFRAERSAAISNRDIDNRNTYHPSTDLPSQFTIHQGKVVKIESFGAFIQLEGYRKHGLVHISQMSSAGRVNDPNDVVSMGDKVFTKVISINDGKIALSMKSVDQSTGNDLDPSNNINTDRKSEMRGNEQVSNSFQQGSKQKSWRDFPPLYSIHQANVTKQESFGLFARLATPSYSYLQGLVHITQLAAFRVDNPSDVATVGDKIWVKVISVPTADNPNEKMSLSMKYVSQSNGIDMDLLNEGLINDKERRRGRDKVEENSSGENEGNSKNKRKGLELGVVSNVDCTKCGAHGHTAAECMNLPGTRYETVPAVQDYHHQSSNKKEGNQVSNTGLTLTNRMIDAMRIIEKDRERKKRKKEKKNEKERKLEEKKKKKKEKNQRARKERKKLRNRSDSDTDSTSDSDSNESSESSRSSDDGDGSSSKRRRRSR